MFIKTQVIHIQIFLNSTFNKEEFRNVRLVNNRYDSNSFLLIQEHFHQGFPQQNQLRHQVTIKIC